MKVVSIPKVLLVLFLFHISGCAVSGCALMKPHEFTLTFIDSKNNPFSGVVAICSGKETGGTIAAEYNEQKLISNANGEIIFHRSKTGRSFSYWSVGLFSWDHKSSDTKATCAFIVNGKEIYKAEVLAFQQSSVIKLER